MFPAYMSPPDQKPGTPVSSSSAASSASSASSAPARELDTFANPRPGREYLIKFECPEFTCLCPKTGQPDFATIRVEYVPDALCVALKSWTLYLWSFRDR